MVCHVGNIEVRGTIDGDSGRRTNLGAHGRAADSSRPCRAVSSHRRDDARLRRQHWNQKSQEKSNPEANERLTIHEQGFSVQLQSSELAAARPAAVAD
jgi:hypothetical protein